jgi:hypothetical protein
LAGLEKGVDLRSGRHIGIRAGAATRGVAALSVALVLAACAYSGPGDTLARLTRVDQGKPYIGMSKAEVLSCAGQPRSRIATGPDTETLIYHYNGAGPVPGGVPAEKPDEKKKKSSSPFSGLSKSKSKATCSASLVFENDKLVRVSYSHMEVRSPYDWQSEDDPEKAEQMKREGVPSCDFSLPRCRRG